MSDLGFDEISKIFVTDSRTNKEVTDVTNLVLNTAFTHGELCALAWGRLHGVYDGSAIHYIPESLKLEIGAKQLFKIKNNLDKKVSSYTENQRGDVSERYIKFIDYILDSTIYNDNTYMDSFSCKSFLSSDLLEVANILKNWKGVPKF